MEAMQVVKMRQGNQKIEDEKSLFIKGMKKGFLYMYMFIEEVKTGGGSSDRKVSMPSAQSTLTHLSKRSSMGEAYS
jgi:hypothetical protein